MTTIPELLAQQEALAKQQLEIQTKLEALRREKRSEVVTQVLQLIEEYRLTSKDLFGNPNSVKKEKPSTIKVAAKYRDPSTGKEWSGRGIPPKWVSASGKNKSEFLISN